MNDFIRITNKVMEEKLKDKIHLSCVMYWTMDGIMMLKVNYRRANDYKEMAFGYSYYGVRYDEVMMETDFAHYIDTNFDSII